jgi:hypothetical protein
MYIHQMPSGIRQIAARTTNSNIAPKITVRQLSHAAKRPQLGALANSQQQQQRNVTIKQLDTDQDSKYLRVI